MKACPVQGAYVEYSKLGLECSCVMQHRTAMTETPKSHCTFDLELVSDVAWPEISHYCPKFSHPSTSGLYNLYQDGNHCLLSCPLGDQSLWGQFSLQPQEIPWTRSIVKLLLGLTLLKTEVINICCFTLLNLEVPRHTAITSLKWYQARNIQKFQGPQAFLELCTVYL